MHIKGGQVMEHMPGRFLQQGQNQPTLVMTGPSRLVGNTYHFHGNSRTISQSGWRRDLDITAMRKAMFNKIYGYFQRQPKFSIWKHKVPTIVMKIEERLFVNASTKEEYMDPNTLEHRFHIIIKSVHSKRIQAGRNCSPQGDNNPIFHSSISATPQASGCLGQQQPSNTFLGKCGNNLLSPTRLNTSGQYIGGLDSAVSYNISQQMVIGIASGINQWPLSFGSLIGAPDVMPTFMENEMPLVDGLATTSEGYLNSSIYDNGQLNSTPFPRDRSMQISPTTGIQYHNEVFPMQNPKDHQLSELQCQEPKNVMIEGYSRSFSMESQTPLTCASDQWEQEWHSDQLTTQSSNNISNGSQTNAVVKQGQCYAPMEQEVHMSEQGPVPEQAWHSDQWTTQSSNNISNGSQTDAVVKQGQCYAPMEQEVHMSEQGPVPEQARHSDQWTTQSSNNISNVSQTDAVVKQGQCYAPMEQEVHMSEQGPVPEQARHSDQWTTQSSNNISNGSQTHAVVKQGQCYALMEQEVHMSEQGPIPEQVRHLDQWTTQSSNNISNGSQTDAVVKQGQCYAPMEPEVHMSGQGPVPEQVRHLDQWTTQSCNNISIGSKTDAVVKQGQCYAPMEPEVHMSEQGPVSHVQKATHQKVTQRDEVRQPQSPHLNRPVCGFGGNMLSTPKIMGVSLTEMFTSDQVKEHIQNLRQCVGQGKLEAENTQVMGESASKNSCKLCGVEKHFLEPPPIYCSLSNDRIKRNGIFYTADNGEKEHYFCNKCYSNHSKSFIVEGVAIPKTVLKKQRNTVEIEEAWVQCDKCETWQHQICALFNPQRNQGGKAKYTCPFCYIEEIESGERKPLPLTAFLGAKDLPRTALSDHIEQRLFRNLKQERQQRAKFLGKKFDEVQGAEGLIVRVVSSIDKKLEVKPRFLDILKNDNYPSEFPYRSKVIMLFQKIEGVDVCLFSMHVQEFGLECPFPNKWHVYLSYLDSVKYFRPEIKAVTGEALRTFVYHEILIGYLDYCKRRGFVSCHIWSSPPLKGDDYILNCHPETQKLPKSDRLREWYRSMLHKAFKENIVVERTDLYDRFFVPVDEGKVKASVTHLPYFDGDYLPDVIEDSINVLQQEEDERKVHKRGRKPISRRALRAAGYASLSSDTSKDILLMQKLGETIYPVKEEFIVANLQYSCSQCSQFIVEEKRWVCSQCRNFQLCQMCHDVEQRLHESEKHPIKNKEKHLLHLVEVNGVPSDNKGKEETIGCYISQTRDMFLNFCRVNHLQYDTLRRAKHSSMILLYHLHNPNEPIFHGLVHSLSQ